LKEELAMATNDKRSQLRDTWVESHGVWSDDYEDLLALNPGFFELLLNFSAHPWRNGVLDPKFRQLVLLAVDAAATHLYTPGVRAHVNRALQLGATPAEIMEVLELTSTMGIHACNVGVPILLEELEAAGHPLGSEPLSERQEEIKTEFTAKRGYWNEFWDGVLRLDPEFFAAYTAFSSWPWDTGVLEPKVKELIYTAFDASATHMFEPGLRQHIRNALALGATKEEVMEVLELTSVIGARAWAVAGPQLRSALEHAEVDTAQGV
jgi:alkylhydroperoxidase/carboxymuconolactone decarboxylase family protein YurZ